MASTGLPAMNFDALDRATHHGRQARTLRRQAAEVEAKIRLLEAEARGLIAAAVQEEILCNKAFYAAGVMSIAAAPRGR